MKNENFESKSNKNCSESTYGHIYVIFHKNLINSNIYIGQTARSIKTRWEEHIKESFNANSKTYNHAIHRAIRLYGINSFLILLPQEYLNYLKEKVKDISLEQIYNERKELTIIPQSQSDLDELEILHIDFFDSFNSGYNETLGGSGSRRVNGFTQTEISTYLQLLQKGFLKNQIVSDILANSLFIDSKGEKLTRKQFNLRLAYSDFSQELLHQIHTLESIAQFYNIEYRMSTFNLILKVELILGLNHQISTSENQVIINQNIKIYEIGRKIRLNHLDITPILIYYKIKPEYFSQIIYTAYSEKPDVFRRRLSEIKNAIIIALFENNHIFSYDYFQGTYSSPQNLLNQYPLPSGLKYRYHPFEEKIKNWDYIDLSTRNFLTPKEENLIQQKFPKKGENYIPIVNNMLEYVSDPSTKGISKKDLYSKFKLYPEIIISLQSILPPEIYIKLSEKKWSRYSTLVKIENVLISNVKIATEIICRQIFGSQVTPSQKMNISKFRKAINEFAKEDLRLSQEFLHNRADFINRKPYKIFSSN